MYVPAEDRSPAPFPLSDEDCAACAEVYLWINLLVVRAGFVVDVELRGEFLAAGTRGVLEDEGGDDVVQFLWEGVKACAQLVCCEGLHVVGVFLFFVGGVLVDADGDVMLVKSWC